MLQQSRLVTVIFLLIIACSYGISAEVTRTKPSSNWQLKIDYCPNAQVSGLIFNTTIPTVLHLDLLRVGKIQDPLFGDNHKKLEWISLCNITYSKNLTFENHKTFEIVFEGIDTYSTIFFNNKQVMKTNNSFVQYRIKLNKEDIKLLTNNLLQVHIYSTKSFDEKGQRQRNMPFLYAHTRKAAYQYSWDWAPNLNTMGIWKDVYIVAYEEVMIDYVWIRNREISKQQAILNFAIVIKKSTSTIREYNLEIYWKQKKLSTSKVNQIYNYIDIKIENPKLWFPNGIGQPYIYDFVVKLVQAEPLMLVDVKKIPYGIRTVQLDQTDKKFTVIVNGHQVYCKGANYVPTDMFYPRTTNPDYTAKFTYKELLNDAAESHFNMIRIWGGGQYESNQFLELASRKGIMLFYDFMFSDSIYPSHKGMLQSIEIQVTQQVRRARNYPCLILWSGNNEILQGIKSWGWGRNNYPQDYKIIFEQTIPAILKKENPQIPYIPSSPVFGIGNSGFDRGGDVHYWGVWAAGQLFQSYVNAIGHFNSQFGTQGIPVWETVKDFTSPQFRAYTSNQFSSHEKHNSKFNTLIKYHQAYAHPSIDFEHEAYLSGLIQAYGVQIAIKHQRASKPKSYGTLYWQFNDAWPAISWSSIDYYGRWKPLQYMAKRLYPDIAIFVANDKIMVVNDNLYPVNALAIIKVQYFNGTIESNRTLQVELGPNEVKKIQDINKTKYSDKLNQIVLYTEIVAGRELEMKSTHFLANFKELLLDPQAKLYVRVLEEHNILILWTDKFIKNLYISSTQQYIKFSDNYFDMIANKHYKVKLTSKHKLKDIRSTLLFRSYIQIHAQRKLDVIYQQSQTAIK